MKATMQSAETKTAKDQGESKGQSQNKRNGETQTESSPAQSPTKKRKCESPKQQVNVSPSVSYIVRRILAAGIQLVGIDFDLTLYRKHTGGAVQMPFMNLFQHMVGITKELSEPLLHVTRALQAAGVHVAIVTFGDDADNNINLASGVACFGGEPLLRPVLNYCLGKTATNKIPIYAKNPDWHRDPTTKEMLFPNNKSWHLEQAMRKFGVSSKKAVLLIDDSAGNIEGARAEGYWALPVRGAKGFTIGDAIAWFEKLDATLDATQA